MKEIEYHQIWYHDLCVHFQVFTLDYSTTVNTVDTTKDTSGWDDKDAIEAAIRAEVGSIYSVSPDAVVVEWSPNVFPIKFNALQEINRALTKHGKTPEQVEWVGSKDGDLSLSWTDFERIANIEYRSGTFYENSGPALDLTIVGDKWWIDRYPPPLLVNTDPQNPDNYDEWQLHEMPARTLNSKPFKNVVGKGRNVDRQNLEQLNP